MGPLHHLPSGFSAQLTCAMEVPFFSIDFTFRAIGLILGWTTLLRIAPSVSFVAAMVGIGAIATAAICLVLRKDRAIAHLREHAKETHVYMAQMDARTGVP